MLSLWKTTFLSTGMLFAAGILAAAPAPVARPGTVNYVEGQVTLNGQSLGAKSIGSTEVEPGQVLQTGQGKAEMLLTPGVYLRLADHSAAKMVSPSLTDTRVELLRGEAMLEADELLAGNHLVVSDHGVDTNIRKNGIYKFTSDPPQVSVYDGKAQVFENDRSVQFGKGKQLTLVADAGLKPVKFDRQQTDSLYQWSDVRSEYLAEANQSSVQTILADPWGWWGMGWYWNPWFDAWDFVPGDGLFYSPFGFGFYSPIYWSYYAPSRYYVRPGVIAATPHVARGFATGSALRGPVMRTPMMRAPAMGRTTMRAPMGGLRMGGFGGRR